MKKVMKKALMAMAILLASTATFAQTTQDSTHRHHQHGTKAKKYTCPMHPEVVKDKPGNCPKCGMKLEPVKEKSKADTTTASYQCPMKCEGDKTYAKAGKCPVCNMDLAKVEATKKAMEGHPGHNHD